MGNPLDDAGARKRTIGLSLNADPCAKAKNEGIILSKVAEEALGHALALHLAEQVRADIRRDLEAHNAFVETNGSFARMVRQHYAIADGDPRV